jgi:UDPglucose 6-dehydrogenase
VPSKNIPLNLYFINALRELEFIYLRVVNDLAKFKQEADVIVSNCITDDINDLVNKLYNRD